jgi:hypothetical protein
MRNEIDPGTNKQTNGRVHELLNKHSNEGPNQINPKREQFLALLKGRYGYTNDKAVDELERLLRQFYQMNRSLGVRHARPNSRHLNAE